MSLAPRPAPRMPNRELCDIAGMITDAFDMEAAVEALMGQDAPFTVVGAATYDADTDTLEA